MKLVLRDHVEHLGERGDIVSVARGYARNYLLPKGLAMEATPGNLKVIEHQRRVWALRDARELREAEALAEQLAQVRVSVTKRAGEGGTLYGSVTASEIAQLLAAKGIEVERRRLVLREPIKSLGEHPVSVKLHPRVIGTFHVEVLSETEAVG